MSSATPTPSGSAPKTPKATPRFFAAYRTGAANATPVLYLSRVRLARCEIFADSSLLGGLFYLRGLLFPRPPPEGPVPPPCPVGHPAPFLSFCGCAILGLLYLVLPLTLIACYMPSVAIRTAINVHCYSCCNSAFFGDDAGLGFGKIKILFLTVFAAAKTHVISYPLDTWNP